MIFSSITFLFYFLPIVLGIYYIVPKKCKNLVLLVASFFFYFYGEPTYVLLMAFSIISTYIFGLLINKYQGTKYAKLWLILAIAVSLGLLIYFKYANFIIENINLWLKHKIDFIYVALPIGISFYTFQMISYLVDVYRKEAKVQKNILKCITISTANCRTNSKIYYNRKSVRAKNSYNAKICTRSKKVCNRT